MSVPTTPLTELTARVEHLLLRHQELQKTHALLQQHMEQVTAERDLLKSKLAAARLRINTLIDRIPAGTEVTQPGELS